MPDVDGYDAVLNDGEISAPAESAEHEPDGRVEVRIGVGCPGQRGGIVGIRYEIFATFEAAADVVAECEGSEHDAPQDETEENHFGGGVLAAWCLRQLLRHLKLLLLKCDPGM